VESRYDDGEAARLVKDLSRAGVSQDLALRTYTARLLGADPSLVLHGGGNTSVKSRVVDLFGQAVDVLHVKGSGSDLATIAPSGHPAVRMDPLTKLRALDALSDEEMVNALRLSLMDAAAATPSIETLLHAFLPAKYIDHTHADSVLAVADQPDADAMCQQIYGKDLVFVPYVMPGFTLAKRCADAFDKNPACKVIVLERHGVFTFGETAKESYERMISAVTRAERFIADRRRTVSLSPVTRFNPTRVAEIVPRLRGALAKLAGEAPERGPVIVLRSTDAVFNFCDRKDAQDLIAMGPATPDHVIRTKPTALLIKRPEFSDFAKLSVQFENELAHYASKYDAYFEEMRAKKRSNVTKLDPWPRVVLLPGLGACCIGKTPKEANIVADIYEHTVDVMLDANEVGTYSPVSFSDLFDIEYWSLEQAKLKKPAPLPLAGRIAMVTGAASGLGRATAEAFLRAGAVVAIVDKDPTRLADTAKDLSPLGPLLSLHSDITAYESARGAVDRTVAAYGGLDIVVSNAGSAPEGRLDSAAGDEALRASLELNLLAHNHVSRAASQVMIAQGRGGCLLFNASKSAFAPGPKFGPYAVAKAALIALMRQYAVDLGQYGVRANAVNADRIRTGLFAEGVAESRAAARGVSVDEYFKANLLHREVNAKDVADAFVYLAGALATTGAVLTVDGGNSAAFPR
jgi:rhamnulose-1-phosphate aldolase/alcohol dehydrogenase